MRQILPLLLCTLRPYLFPQVFLVVAQCPCHVLCSDSENHSLETNYFPIWQVCFKRYLPEWGVKINIKVHVTWTKRWVCFNLVSDNIHFYIMNPETNNIHAYFRYVSLDWLI